MLTAASVPHKRLRFPRKARTGCFSPISRPGQAHLVRDCYGKYKALPATQLGYWHGSPIAQRRCASSRRPSMAQFGVSD
eukprot:scaffold1854_cov124-Pinguiococcus_pyrenoidosus.AAC.1